MERVWGGRRSRQGFGWKPEGKRSLGRPDVDARIVLKWIFRKWNGWIWTGLSWVRIGTGGGHL
jgi:hypothetical protein